MKKAKQTPQKKFAEWFQNRMLNVFNNDQLHKTILDLERYYLIYHLKDIEYKYGPKNQFKITYYDYLNEHIEPINTKLVYPFKVKNDNKYKNFENNLSYFLKAVKDDILKYGTKYLHELFPEPLFDYSERKLFQRVEQVLAINPYKDDLKFILRDLQTIDVNKYSNYMKDFRQLQKNIIMTVIYAIMKYKLELENYQEKNNMKAEKWINELNLPDELFEKGYKYYAEKWEEKTHDSNKFKPQKVNIKHTTTSKMKPPKATNAEEYIEFYIINDENNESNLKTEEEITALIIPYNYHYKTFKQLYTLYVKWHNQIVNYKPLLTPELIELTGYKSKDKINSLISKKVIKRTLPQSIREVETKNYFPLKQNQKLYLHTIAPKYSYLIDLLIENRKFIYLVAININTRKLWVELTNIDIDENDLNETHDDDFEKRIINKMKDSKSYVNALKRIIRQGAKIRYLKFDGEKSFQSNHAKSFYASRKPPIEFIEIERQITKYPEFMKDLNMVKSIKSEPKHTSLSIIDRVIRTIRDIAFNMNEPEITSKVMRKIVHIYNNAPHATLSKYAGQLVSPNEVNENPDLELFIVRKIHQENFNISSKLGYDIRPGEEVIIYNERNNMAKRRSQIQPGTWFINERIGNKFSIKDEFGNVVKRKIKDQNNNIIEVDKLLSRYQIHPKGQSILPF